MSPQTVFITGVHTGIGRALCEQLLADGARVYAVSRSAPEGLEHSALRFASLDLRDLEAIPTALQELLDGVDALDLVLLNAGVLGELKDLKDTSIDALRAVMDVNVWANKMLIDALLGRVSRIAQVVAISSGAAFNGSGGWGAYSISKSALNLLVRVYAHEHPQTHFTALAPGVIETGMIHHILSRPSDPRYSAHGRIQQAHEQGRIMQLPDAAVRLVACFPALRERDSGGYADLRQL